MAQKDFDSPSTSARSTLRPRSMCGRCLMRIPCLPSWLVHSSSSCSTHTRVLAIPACRELARMPVFPHAFRCLHTESSPVWCNELRFLVPINHESLFSHLDLLIWVDDMLGYASDADRLVATLKAVFDICMENGLKAQPSQVRSGCCQCPFLRPNHRFQGYQVSPR